MVLRGDNYTPNHQNPIQRDIEGNDGTEPRHDATDYKEFTKPALIREVYRVQAGQNLQLSADGHKADLIAQLESPLYEPSFETLSSRCRDLGLDPNATAYKLRKALDRRHRDDRFVPQSQLWTPQELLKLCGFRGLGGSVSDPASLLYRLFKYELQVAQDRPQQGNRHELDWRLIHCQDPCYFPAPLTPELEAAYHRLHPPIRDTLWTEAYIGNGHPSFVPPTTNQQRMEVALERLPILQGFEGHPAEQWSQMVPLDGFQDVQWRGMKTLFRSFAIARNNADWRSVEAAVQTLWLNVMDVRRARVAQDQINNAARYRRLLYERLDTSTRRHPWRGRLLDQLFDWRVEGTMEMIQLLADAYCVEILVHIPHCHTEGKPPEEWEPEWKVLSRGSTHLQVNMRQINLVHYSSINRWTHVRHIPHGEEPVNDFRYTAHMDIDLDNKYHLRPIIEDPFRPDLLAENRRRRDDGEPNYNVDFLYEGNEVEDLTQHRHNPNEDLFFTGGTGRLTTAEDYVLVQEVRRAAQLMEDIEREQQEERDAAAVALRDALRTSHSDSTKTTSSTTPRSTRSSGRGKRHRCGSDDDDDDDGGVNAGPSQRRPRRRQRLEDGAYDRRPSPARPHRAPLRDDETEVEDERGRTRRVRRQPAVGSRSPNARRSAAGSQSTTPFGDRWRERRRWAANLQQAEPAAHNRIPEAVLQRSREERRRRDDEEDEEEDEEDEEEEEEEEEEDDEEEEDEEVERLAEFLQREENYAPTVAGIVLREETRRRVTRARMTLEERLAADRREEEANARRAEVREGMADVDEGIAKVRMELQEMLDERGEFVRQAQEEDAQARGRSLNRVSLSPFAYLSQRLGLWDEAEEAELAGEENRLRGERAMREVGNRLIAQQQAEEEEEARHEAWRMAAEGRQAAENDEEDEEEQEQNQEDHGLGSSNVETQPGPARAATRQSSWLRGRRTTVPETQQESEAAAAAETAPNPPAPRPRASRRIRGQPPAGTTPPQQKTPEVNLDGSQEGDSGPESPTPAPRGRGGNPRANGRGGRAGGARERGRKRGQ